MVDGALTRVDSGGDIVTREQFQDFDLALECKVAPGGNSGIFYRVAEAPFAAMPPYGREPRGHIALQDHGDWVAYRNIRIRRIAGR